MTREHLAVTDTRIAAALTDLRGLLRQRYPEAIFDTFIGDDPEGVYLRVTLDLDEPDEALETVRDRLFDLQVEQELPVYVIPVRTPNRMAALLTERVRDAAATTVPAHLRAG